MWGGYLSHGCWVGEGKQVRALERAGEVHSTVKCSQSGRAVTKTHRGRGMEATTAAMNDKSQLPYIADV